MTKYIVKEHSILYKEVEADSPEEAEEIALGEPVHVAESYVEIEEGELLCLNLLIILINKFVLTVTYPAILVRVDLLTDILFTMMM